MDALRTLQPKRLSTETCVARLHNVTHVYGRPPHQLPVLEDINLEFHTGKITVIMGHSGSGKTTLLSVLGLLLRPTRGTVEFASQSISTLPEKQLAACRRSHVSFIFQGFNLLSALTAAENIQVGLALQGVLGGEAQQASLDLLERVDLLDRATHRPAQLSCGQQQRVAIARALASPAPLLLADEPTANLDGRNATRTSELLRELAHVDKRAVVVVTHDPRMMDYADRVVKIEGGAILSDN